MLCSRDATILAPPPPPPANSPLRNIFDLGCAYTTDMYHSEGVSFHATRAKLLPRPWVIDDMDALLDRLCRWGSGAVLSLCMCKGGGR